MAQEYRRTYAPFRHRRMLSRVMASALAVALLLGQTLPVMANPFDPNPYDYSAPEAGEMPAIEVESNAVVDDFGNLTGYLEVALRVQTGTTTSGGEGEEPAVTTEHPFRYLATALEYNPLLTPVSWETAVADPITGEVEMVTTELDVSGTSPHSFERQVQMNTIKRDDITTAIAYVSQPGEDTGGQKTGGMLYFMAESTQPVAFPEMTTLAVVRFRYDMAALEAAGGLPLVAEDGSYDAKWTNPDSGSWLVRFAPAQIAGGAYNTDTQLLYRSDSNGFFFSDDSSLTPAWATGGL